MAAAPDGGHVMTVRVYYEDTDAGGVVYHASYLRFAERARTEFLRSAGAAAAPGGDGAAWAVRRCEADFLRPARLDDLLEVGTSLAGASAARLRFRQDVRRGGETLAVLRTEIVRVRRDGRPTRIPAGLRRAAPAAATAAAAGW